MREKNNGIKELLGVPRVKDKKGYVYLKCPGHPFADKSGLYPEHRLVVERYIQRFLKPTEVVHHLNGEKDDNAIDNLMIFNTNKAHMSFHTKMKKMQYLTTPMKMQILNRWNDYVPKEKQ